MSDIRFADPETLTIARLRPGDFVIEIPAQHGARGAKPNSGLATAEDDWETWTRRIGRRGRIGVHSRRLTFLARDLGTLNVPASFEVTARRRLEG